MKHTEEVWLRGERIEGIIPQLQPVADALLQAEEEINNALSDWPDNLLFIQPAQCASVGFHLLHICGFLDRLLTYAEEKNLNASQLNFLKTETKLIDTNTKQLLIQLHESIDATINRLKQFNELDLSKSRKVGRAGLPSTVVGLCFHAGEHTMRHVGQLIVTIKILKEYYAS